MPIHPCPIPPHIRKRGAQPGNNNALTHGLYANPTNTSLNANSRVHIDLNDEIALLRTYIRRIAEMTAPPEDLDHAIQTLRVLSFATHTLTRMVHTQAFLLPPRVGPLELELERLLDEIGSKMAPEADSYQPLVI
jgi:hypothetical protein